jgi:DNA-binding IclR family transcriptional regulator
MAGQSRTVNSIEVDQETGSEDKGGSFSRALAILDMFSISKPQIALDEVGAKLNCSQATAYRYLAYLGAAGLISPTGNGNYGIGPRILELERLALVTDPLLIATRNVIDGHVPPLGDSVYRLCSLYGNKVLCVYKQGPDHITVDGVKLELQRARGSVMPLFRGAPSLAILAFMSGPRIQSLYLNNTAEIARLGLGDDWPAFKARMNAIRRDGKVVTRGQYISQIAAIAIPLRKRGRNTLIGSLTYVLPIKRLDADPENVSTIVADLQALASRINDEMEHLEAAG